MLRVYSILHQASEYLQTAGLNYLSAWNMVEDVKQQLDKVAFDDIHMKTSEFITKCNEVAINSNIDSFTVEIEADFRPQRVKLTKCMSDERAKTPDRLIQL